MILLGFTDFFDASLSFMDMQLDTDLYWFDSAQFEVYFGAILQVWCDHLYVCVDHSDQDSLDTVLSLSIVESSGTGSVIIGRFVSVYS